MDVAIQLVQKRIEIIGKVISALQSEKNEILISYKSALSGIRLKFLLMTTSIQSSDCALRSEIFQKNMANEGYRDQLNMLMTNIIKFYQTVTQTATIAALIAQYPFDDEKDSGGAIKLAPEKCSCGGARALDTVQSVMICKLCGEILELHGVVFESTSQTSIQINANTSYQRHFDIWMMRILAMENEEEINKDGEWDKIQADILELIKKKNYIRRKINIDKCRELLKAIGRTDLNKNAALILKKITGVGPPILHEDYRIQIRARFIRALALAERIKYGGKSRGYYPHYIYKIADDVIPESDYEQRRFLFYIYIQSKEAVENDDIEWEEICKLSEGEFKYKPTDRNANQVYMP